MRALGLCILVFVALATAEDEKICEPGSHFMDDCNSCICSDDGTDAECSRMLCPDGPSRTKRTTIPVCQPGSTTKKNGATCTCNAEGTTLHCTTKRSSSVASQPSEDFANHHGQPMENPFFRHVRHQGLWDSVPSSHSRERRHQLSEDDNYQCVPNSRFKQACNWCTCSSDGLHAMCTLMRCYNVDVVPVKPRERRQVLSEGDNYQCVPNSRFKIDCNWCTCSPDGRSAMCTLMGCLNFDVAPNKPRERRQVLSEGDNYQCVPNSRFKIDCNWCTCSPDGQNVMCTLMGCLNYDVTPNKPRERRQVPSDGDAYQCVPNSSFKDDCNWCTCLPDGRSAACTDMACVGSQESKENGSI